MEEKNRRKIYNENSTLKADISAEQNDPTKKIIGTIRQKKLLVCRYGVGIY